MIVERTDKGFELIQMYLSQHGIDSELVPTFENTPTHSLVPQFVFIGAGSYLRVEDSVIEFGHNFHEHLETIIPELMEILQ